MLGGDLADAVRAATRERWPSGGPHRGRLFAFGFDAFRLAQALRQRGAAGNISLQGLTGRLGVDAERRVHREMDWAQLHNGRAAVVAGAGALTSADPADAHRATAKRTTRRELAAEFLRAHGFEILHRNYLRRLGELDLIARRAQLLVIAEVRTRSSAAFGRRGGERRPAQTAAHRPRASQLLQQRADLAQLPVRFDVIVVRDPHGEAPRIEWIQYAFERETLAQGGFPSGTV